MTTYGQYLSIEGMKATADLSSSQYLAVKLASTAHGVKICSSTLDAAIGLLQNDPESGHPADVAYLGKAKGIANGSSVEIGSVLTCDTTGQLEPTTTDNHVIIGQSLTDAGAAGDIIEVLLLGAGRY